MEYFEEAAEVMHEPSKEFVEQTNIYQFMQRHDIDGHEELIDRTTTDIDWFWDVLPDELGIEFYEDYETVRDDSEGPQFSNWYPGGKINIAHNVVDRHAAVDSPTRNKLAVLWEGENGEQRRVTFHDLHRQSNQVANALESRGVGKGDTVGIYMQMVPEILSVLYGCLKVGAIVVPLFSGFAADAVATRIDDAECSVLFTMDGFYRRGSEVTLKDTADTAIEDVGHVEHTIVFDRLGTDVSWHDDRDEWWKEAVQSQSPEYETRELDSDDESMIIYTSGTTGKPKGTVHTHAGQLMQCAKEIYYVFDLDESDRVFWNTDMGWMSGPWSVLGTHAFAGTLLLYEGAPDYPDPDRFWDMIDRHNITKFGMSPTAVRGVRKFGEEWLEPHDLSSLEMIISAGGPWDPESWRWCYEKVGNGDLPIMNVSGGTEICGSFVFTLPNQSLKPCTVGGPAIGMDVDVVDSDCESVIDDDERGYLIARDSCPSMTKGLWKNDDRYLNEYWSTWDDVWDHGDWAFIDEDGFWYLLGRADDVINVAGKRVGPSEVESATLDHDEVTQAVAIGVPDDTKGAAIVVYAIVDGNENEELRSEISTSVTDRLGKPFKPREIRFVNEFPRTQSGKIVRRAVESAYTGEDMGDLSSLENPESLESIRQPN